MFKHFTWHAWRTSGFIILLSLSFYLLCFKEFKQFFFFGSIFLGACCCKRLLKVNRECCWKIYQFLFYLFQELCFSPSVLAQNQIRPHLSFKNYFRINLVCSCLFLYLFVIEIVQNDLIWSKLYFLILNHLQCWYYQWVFLSVLFPMLGLWCKGEKVCIHWV